MNAIEWARVGDVLRLERRQVQIDVSGEYEEIGVRSFGRGIFHKEPIDGATLGSKRVFRIEPGDLVISNVFAWEGAIAVASEAEAGKIGSHRFMTFVPTDGRMDPSWAAWYFGSEPGIGQIRKASPGSAGRNKTLAVKRFEDLVVPLPPIDEQNRLTLFLATASEQARALGAALTEQGPEGLVATLPRLTDEVIRQYASGRAAVGELVDLVSASIHRVGACRAGRPLKSRRWWYAGAVRASRAGKQGAASGRRRVRGPCRGVRGQR